MAGVMLQGEIICSCGNEFWFRSIRELVPCMKCGKMHENEGEEIIEDNAEDTAAR